MIDEKKLLYDFSTKVHKERFADYKTGGKGIYYLMDDVIRCIEKQPKVGGWILFSKKPPIQGQKVIVCKNGKTFEDLFEFDFPEEWQKEDDVELIGFLYGEITDGFAVLNNEKIYWQPLPQPYKENRS